jgi:hypothetical protein
MSWSGRLNEFGTGRFGGDWGTFALLFFAPDLSFMG